MKKILISAYGCEPLKGSESGVGWNWVLQMAKNNRLYVITRANNRQLIEQYLPKEVSKNLSFYYYDTSAFIRKMKNRSRGLYFYYFCWQLGIMPLVTRIIKEHKVDYTMHLTFGSMWMPTFLPFKKPPFIWGPIGGGDCEPRSFMKGFDLKQRVLLNVRSVMKTLSFLHPSIVIPAWKARRIICRTEETADTIPSFFKHKTVVELETAMESDIFNHSRRDRTDGQIRFISTGRLTASKNIHTAVRALALIPRGIDFHYTVVGSGPQKEFIEREAKRLGIWDKMELIAEMTREEVLRIVEESDVYLFPSLREGGSWALMEAMAIGLPVICLNWAGMKITVNDNCAFRLPVTTPGQMAQDMAEAIMKLVESPDLRKQMGNAGRERIRTIYNWDTKGKFMEDLLTELEGI